MSTPTSDLSSIIGYAFISYINEDEQPILYYPKNETEQLITDIEAKCNTKGSLDSCYIFILLKNRTVLYSRAAEFNNPSIKKIPVKNYISGKKTKKGVKLDKANIRYIYGKYCNVWIAVETNVTTYAEDQISVYWDNTTKRKILLAVTHQLSEEFIKKQFDLIHSKAVPARTPSLDFAEANQEDLITPSTPDFPKTFIEKVDIAHIKAPDNIKGKTLPTPIIPPLNLAAIATSNHEEETNLTPLTFRNPDSFKIPTGRVIKVRSVRDPDISSTKNTFKEKLTNMWQSLPSIVKALGVGLAVLGMIALAIAGATSSYPINLLHNL